MHEASISDLDTAKRLMRCLGYTGLTSLQARAVDTGDLFSDKNMLVVGETSSGKTLIPLLAYYHALSQTPVGKSTPKMLFVVPYRALASQKLREIGHDLELLGEEGLCAPVRVEQSTGEYRQADEDIFNAKVDVAIVITEKAFRFASNDSKFLSRYDFLVIDELGLVDDESRGTCVDFMLMWAHSQRVSSGSPRIFGLGTPSFAWDRYVESYGFTYVVDTERPIPLEEHVLKGVSNAKFFEFAADVRAQDDAVVPTGRFYFLNAVRYLESKDATVVAPCAALGRYCPLREPCRSDLSMRCEKTGKPCSSPARIVRNKTELKLHTIEQICRAHLLQGRQIIIFKNNREEIRGLCRTLFERLRDVLPEPEDASSCKAELLDECKLTEDDLYGIMEDASPGTKHDDVYYRAFAAGIGFHSRAMPSELRSYVERRLLESRQLKIVCCTETLAFGVNSNVDVVIVSDIMKQESAHTRRLSANEYRNYMGRAGRLSEGRTQEDKGYVYTYLGSSVAAQEAYGEIGAEIAAPKMLYCRLYGEDENALPLFVLNLIHSSDSSLTHEEIMAITEALPIRDEAKSRASFGYKLYEALDKLEEEGLAVDDFNPFTQEIRYGLTELGNSVSGFIVSWKDFLHISESLRSSFRGLHEGICIEELTFKLLGTKHMSTVRNSFVNHGVIDLDALRTYFKKKTGDKSLSAAWLRPLRKAAKPVDAKMYYLLAAILSWSEGDSSGALVRNFGIQYPLIQSMGQQLDHLYSIAERIVPRVVAMDMEEQRAKNPMIARMFNAREWEESIQKRIVSIQEQLRDLSDSVYFGIDLTIRKKFVSYLVGVGGERAEELARDVDGRIDPTLARNVRRLVVRYKFFAGPSRANDSNIELRNNYLQTRSLYMNDLHSMGELYEGFIEAEHPETYTAA